MMTTQAPPLTVFLSHSSADKAHVRRLAAAITLTGTRVWFDEWEVRPGDQLPNAVGRGLASSDVLALVWSAESAKSPWVNVEMNAAFTRSLKDPSVRLVPVLLDRTALPPLFSSLVYIDGSDGDYQRITRHLLGIPSEAAYRMAVQAFIDDAGLEFREFWGAGIYVTCPQCGTTADNLRGWQRDDDVRGDRYAGAECSDCGWSDGGAI
jgi:hypothetical protein